MRRSKVDLIYEPLRRELLQLPVGSRAGSIRELMRRYETSQLSITRVLSRLIDEGLLARRPDGTLFISGEVDHDKKRIGLLLPDWPSVSFVEIEERLKLSANKSDIQVQRVNYPCSYSFRELRTTGFDALVLLPDHPLTAEDLYFLSQVPIPLVVMGRVYEEIKMNFVSSSSLGDGVLAASYLYRKGHRDLAVVISEPHNSVIRGRWNGFVTFSRAAGCRVREIECGIVNGESSVSKTHAVFSEFLDRQQPDFTAVYVLSDSTALSVICALSEHGFKVPDDISVIGADGSNQGAFFLPPLTTAGPNFEEYIARILDVIETLWRDPERICQVIIDAVVVERGSVKSLT
ncbi:substrate-binding domain-containing protein [uncultured Victivallis sp.]|uniref:substrate-binding domain-containing protein n=1 Tax=uncultured Victivallis sp. TaxID=354118 RepID=UPI0025F1E7D4|nr:substrate-binding domain-containing protein [uncultured Victivallis sp.]